MMLFPAIDLKNGQCVRLLQGDFTKTTIYETDPVKQARKFADSGATWMHMVDLDGAKIGEMQQFDLVAQVVKEVPLLNIEVGGGVRDEATVERLLSVGVKRVVLGSLAIKNRPLVSGWIKKFGPEKIIIAFDIRLTDGEPEIMTHGWQSGSQQLLWDVLEAYEGTGLAHILCTDVSRDGMLGGTNHHLYAAIMQRHPEIKVLASGGVSGLEDLLQLKTLGVEGAIIGKAIYEGKLDLAETLRVVKNAS